MNNKKIISCVVLICLFSFVTYIDSKGGKGKQPQQSAASTESASTSSQPASPAQVPEQDITNATPHIPAWKRNSQPAESAHISRSPSPTTDTPLASTLPGTTIPSSLTNGEYDGELLEKAESSEQFPASRSAQLADSIAASVATLTQQVAVTFGETAVSVGTVFGQTMTEAGTKLYKNVIGHDNYCLAGIANGELSQVLQHDRIRAQHDLEHALSLLKKQLVTQLAKNQWVEDKQEREKTKSLLAGWSTIISFYNTHKQNLTLDPKIISENDNLISTAIQSLALRKKTVHTATFNYFAHLLHTRSNAQELSGAPLPHSSLPLTHDVLFKELFGDKPVQSQLLYSPQSQD